MRTVFSKILRMSALPRMLYESFLFPFLFLYVQLLSKVILSNWHEEEKTREREKGEDDGDYFNSSSSTLFPTKSYYRARMNLSTFHQG